jgi:hypothetical protein
MLFPSRETGVGDPEPDPDPEFLGLPDPETLVRGTDPDLAPGISFSHVLSGLK